jgi:hypothetical protein
MLLAALQYNGVLRFTQEVLLQRNITEMVQINNVFRGA